MLNLAVVREKESGPTPPHSMFMILLKVLPRCTHATFAQGYKERERERKEETEMVRFRRDARITVEKETGFSGKKRINENFIPASSPAYRRTLQTETDGRLENM